jgi:hypothetical protein
MHLEGTLVARDKGVVVNQQQLQLAQPLSPAIMGLAGLVRVMIWGFVLMIVLRHQIVSSRILELPTAKI